MGEAARLLRKTNPLQNPDGISTLLARLDSMERKMNEKIDAISHTIDEKLEKLRGDMKEDLKAELFPDIRRNTDDIAAHSNSISDLQRRIQHLE
jgi:glycerophosphoryl diester phosphodiesterase